MILRASALGMGLIWVGALLLLMLKQPAPWLAVAWYGLSCAAASRGGLRGRVGSGALSGAIVGLGCSAVVFFRDASGVVDSGLWLLLIALGALAGALGALPRGRRARRCV